MRLTGGLVLNGGGITKRGVGTAEVFGTVDYGGETNVEAGSLRLLGLGTLTGPIKVGQDAVLEIGESQQLASSVRLSGNGQVSGDLVMPGIIAPGESAGTLTLLDDLTLVNGSSLEIEVGGTQSGVVFDLLQVVGLASLSGELQVTLIDDFLPQIGDAFEILNAFGGVENTFESTVLPTLEEGLSWSVEYGSNYVLLAVQAAATLLPGDYNRDGVVNAADYVLWRDTLGSMDSLDADGNLSGTVDEGDFPVWSANFGNANSSGNGTESFATSSVPEPGMLSITVLVVTLLSAVCVSKRLLGRSGGR